MKEAGLKHQGNHAEGVYRLSYPDVSSDHKDPQQCWGDDSQIKEAGTFGGTAFLLASLVREWYGYEEPTS